MKTDREPETQQDPTEWSRECLELSRRLNDALMRNDLAAIEACLDLEATLLSKRPNFRARDAAIPRTTVQEIRSLNNTNRELIHNGFDFARTLLDVIRPPATYSALVSGVAQPVVAEEPRFSVKC